MNSLIKAMLSLDRRSKSVDDRKRGSVTAGNGGGCGGGSGSEASSNKSGEGRSGDGGSVIEKQSSFDKTTNHHRRGKVQHQLGGASSGGSGCGVAGVSSRSSKFLEIPSIRYNLISKSFEIGLETGGDGSSGSELAVTCSRDTRSLCSRENSEESPNVDDMFISPPLSPSVKQTPQVDRASRISFFRFSKIGKRIRKKLSSSSGLAGKSVKRDNSCDDQATPVERTASASAHGGARHYLIRMSRSEDPDDAGVIEDEESTVEASCTSRPRWKSSSLRKPPQVTTTHVPLVNTRSAGSSFDSRTSPCESIRRAYSSSPVAANRINVSLKPTEFSPLFFSYSFLVL